jgi:hypothetical protein
MWKQQRAQDVSQSGVVPTLQLPFCIYASNGNMGAGLEKLQRGPTAVGLWYERIIFNSVKIRPMLGISHVEMDRQSHLTSQGRNVPFFYQLKHRCVILIQGVHGNIT